MLDGQLLHIDRLSISFSTENGMVHAVQDLQLQLMKGESIGIVGESGSGNLSPH